MKDITIYCNESSELASFEALSRGYRQIYVSKGNDFFMLNVYDIIRLQQDFLVEIESSGFYGVEPNIVVVKEVTNKNVVFTVEQLYEQHYFDFLKPINPDDFERDSMQEMTIE
jgi:hypothetical protein